MTRTSLSKALALLDLFGPDAPAMGLSDLARRAGRDKATTYRHVGDLVAAGLLEQDCTTRAYHLGPALDRWAALRRETVPSHRRVAARVDALAAETGELCILTRFDGIALVVDHHAAPARRVRVAFDPRSLPPPMATASGLAILGHAPLETVERIETDHRTRFPDLAVPPDLVDTLAGVARTGIARLRDGVDEAEDGVVGLAVACFDAEARVSGACEVSIPDTRAGAPAIARATALLARAAPDLSQRQGGRVPDATARLWEAAAFRDELDL
ncbi:MAG: IclR family transcriptional regulator [Shimia sp.]